MPRCLPLPKRFNAALTEAAHTRLQEPIGRNRPGNDYLLAVRPARLDDDADMEALVGVFAAFTAEYSAPAPTDARRVRARTHRSEGET